MGGGRCRVRERTRKGSVMLCNGSLGEVTILL